jgi:energy-coupling factor transporter ATP-binding protein EcfA2
MRLVRARVQRYRSVRDTGLFDVEHAKTILVGPNEAGKSAILQALQQINPPEGVEPFEALRDYPRSEYNDISTGKVDPDKVNVVEGHFALDDSDKAVLLPAFQDVVYVSGRYLSNRTWHRLDGGPKTPSYGELRKDLGRLCVHMDARVPEPEEGAKKAKFPSEELLELTREWSDQTLIDGKEGAALNAWLKKVIGYVDESNAAEEARYDSLELATNIAGQRKATLDALNARTPVFVLFNNYFRVRPLIHLAHLAARLNTGVLDDDQYDYGNSCLLKLLGFTAQQLSDLGKVGDPPAGNPNALKNYRDQLDRRSYQLNAASVRLTTEIRKVWQPNPERAEADNLRMQADGQYLKVVVQDELGVEIELNQRSEGFQWLVSFFVVFFAEAQDEHENAILLLDEPGLSLHGLKQREFRTTISRLAESNQTLYTTHSPFLVGPEELDLVRVVEMTDRKIGTKVHTTITADDPASLLPLQEALGYDLAQSLFGQQRNMVLEGLTDYWYIDAAAEMLREGGVVDLNDKIALVPASSAGKVVYYATILHAQKLKVAALLDSDAAGDQAAAQDVLVGTLGNKNILRTKDYYKGPVTKPEIEDLLRETLVALAKADLGWDVTTHAAGQPSRPIADIFVEYVPGFSKYKLAKAFLRWSRAKVAADLAPGEREQLAALFAAVNKALK